MGFGEHEYSLMLGEGLGMSDPARSDPSPLGAFLGSRSDPSPLAFPPEATMPEGAFYGQEGAFWEQEGAFLGSRRCVLGSRRLE